MNLTKVKSIKQINVGEKVAISTANFANLTFGMIICKYNESVFISLNDDSLQGQHLEINKDNLKYFELYIVKFDTIELRKTNKKLTNKVRKYEKIMKDNNFVSVQSIQEKVNNNKSKLGLVNNNIERIGDYIVEVKFYTNNEDIVQCKIIATPHRNPGLEDICTATGEAKSYYDKFVYKKGKELAYARALTAFLEGMM